MLIFAVKRWVKQPLLEGNGFVILSKWPGAQRIEKMACTFPGILQHNIELLYEESRCTCEYSTTPELLVSDIKLGVCAHLTYCE